MIVVFAQHITNMNAYILNKSTMRKELQLLHLRCDNTTTSNYPVKVCCCQYAIQGEAQDRNITPITSFAAQLLATYQRAV
jgi:hypothetical protein